jgi:nitrate reductase NapE
MPNFMRLLRGRLVVDGIVIAGQAESTAKPIPQCGSKKRTLGRGRRRGTHVRIDPDQDALSDSKRIIRSRYGPDAANLIIRVRRNMSAAGDDTTGRPRRRRMEIFAFLFLTAVLMPAAAVATVGSYGLAVWVYQMLAGPPGPPPR